VPAPVEGDDISRANGDPFSCRHGDHR
jgi:hypothetical protein